MFQFGEFYYSESSQWLELLVNFIGILVGAGIAIFVFRLGKRAERNDEKIRLTQIKVAFILGIIKTQENVKRVIIELRNLITLLSKEDFSDLIIEPKTLNTNSLNWINKNDLFQVFVLSHKTSKETIAIYWQTMDGLDVIDRFNTDFLKAFKSCGERLEKYYSLWATTIVQLGKLRDKMNVNYDHNLNKVYPFLDQVNIITAKWWDIDNHKTYHNAYKHLLIPLKNLCSNPDTKYDGNVLEMVGYVNELIYSYNNLLKVRKIYSQIFETKVNGLKSVNTVLDAFVKKHSVKTKKK